MKTSQAMFWVVVAGLAAVGVWPWRSGVRLRAERAALQARADERRSLEAERARLTAARAPADQMEALHEERAAVERLRSEIDRLQRGAEARARTAAGADAPRAKVARAPVITEEFVPFGAWRNRGQGTPSDTLETALWAAAGGDLKMLAGAIYLDPPAREKAQRLRGRLPAEVAAQFPTAEDLLALLATKDVPLAEAHLIDPQAQMPEGTAVRVVQLREETGKMRLAALELRHMAAGEWRVIVPEKAVDRYAAQLSRGPGEGKN